MTMATTTDEGDDDGDDDGDGDDDDDGDGDDDLDDDSDDDFVSTISKSLGLRRRHPVAGQHVAGYARCTRDGVRQAQHVAG